MTVAIPEAAAVISSGGVEASGAGEGISKLGVGAAKRSPKKVPKTPPMPTYDNSRQYGNTRKNLNQTNAGLDKLIGSLAYENTGNVYRKILVAEFLVAFGLRWSREFFDPKSPHNKRGMAGFDQIIGIMLVYMILGLTSPGRKSAKASAALGFIIMLVIVGQNLDFLGLSVKSFAPGTSVKTASDDSTTLNDPETPWQSVIAQATGADTSTPVATPAPTSQSVAPKSQTFTTTPSKSGVQPEVVLPSVPAPEVAPAPATAPVPDESGLSGLVN